MYSDKKFCTLPVLVVIFGNFIPILGYVVTPASGDKALLRYRSPDTGVIPPPEERPNDRYRSYQVHDTGYVPQDGETIDDIYRSRHDTGILALLIAKGLYDALSTNGGGEVGGEAQGGAQGSAQGKSNGSPFLGSIGGSLGGSLNGHLGSIGGNIKFGKGKDDYKPSYRSYDKIIPDTGLLQKFVQMIWEFIYKITGFRYFFPLPVGTMPSVGDTKDLIKNIPYKGDTGDLIKNIPYKEDTGDLIKNISYKGDTGDLIKNIPHKGDTGDIIRNLPQTKYTIRNMEGIKHLFRSSRETRSMPQEDGILDVMNRSFDYGQISNVATKFFAVLSTLQDSGKILDTTNKLQKTLSEDSDMMIKVGGLIKELLDGVHESKSLPVIGEFIQSLVDVFTDGGTRSDIKDSFAAFQHSETLPKLGNIIKKWTIEFDKSGVLQKVEDILIDYKNKGNWADIGGLLTKIVSTITETGTADQMIQLAADLWSLAPGSGIMPKLAVMSYKLHPSILKAGLKLISFFY